MFGTPTVSGGNGDIRTCRTARAPEVLATETASTSPATEIRESPTNIRWMVFGLASASSFLLYLHRYTWGIIRVQLATEFDWDAVDLGWLDSAFAIFYAAGQIPAGILGDGLARASCWG